MTNKIYCIAEAGINHNGKIDLAKKLMKLAKDSGCDAVKFQKRTPEICIPKWKALKIIDAPLGYMPYLEYKQKIELWEKEYDEIDKYSKEIGIEWFASAWDVPSYEFLQKYKLTHNKIPSAMVTHKLLVEKVAADRTYTFISTGMSTLNDIDQIVNIFKKYDCPFTLMHCVSAYPCPNDKLNLRMINTLQARYGCDVGYSSHSPGVLDKSLAVSLGATAIEFHITLDRAMWGTDQAASLEPRGIGVIMRDVNNISEMLGTGKKVILEQEKEAARKQRYWA